MSKKIDLYHVDIISVLDELDISYTTDGKNVSRGWIGVNCPFCDDPSNHFGINIDTKVCHCFRCPGGKSGFLKYVQQVSGLQWVDVFKLVSECSSKPFFTRKNYFLAQDSISTKTNIEVPKEVKELQNGHRRYLISRGFNPTELIEKFHIKGAPAYGYFAYRVVIPVYENNKLVNITGRDVTGLADLRYLSLPNEEAVIPIKDCLYNYDSPGKSKIFVEGAIDAWRFGDYSIGTFGTEVTSNQIKKIYNLELKKALVCFDDKAEKQADSFAWELSTFIPEVDVLFLNKDDPGNLTRKEAFHIIKTYLM